MSKSRENSRVGGRSSGIALLVASTILLAAAGETMWHANANASASEGRWAGPRVGVAAAMMAADAAAIAEANDAAVAEEEINSMTLPDFKPFVFVP
ncbi:MAG: hypothetical protein KJZ69_19140, partial [Phycisphaerales bacterium]|nr:hypothetical protein [Phycisphaerales bacterium]